MDKRLLGMYISRILSGFYIFIYNNQKYKLVYPDINLKYEAELYAQEEYNQNKFNEWISEEDIVYHLINAGLWSHNGDDNLTNIEKQIDNLKIDLYKNHLNPTKVKSLKRTLSNTIGSYNRLYGVRHSFDQYTTEGYTQQLKNNYILVHSLYDHNNKRVFNSYEDADSRLLGELSATISENIVEVSAFREIARSDIWKNYWSANEQNLFDRATINWTDEQKTLVILTKMYSSANEHPECPPQSVIDDDDMFDGWMLVQKQENDKVRNKNRAEKLLSGKNLDKAGEVFVVANSKEEAKNIFDLNDPNSRNIIRERTNFIHRTANSSTINEADLPDVQRNLVAQSNENFKNNVRR